MIGLHDIQYRISSKVIVQDIHIDLAPGQLVALTGPNGAGKSTLIQLISGDLSPSSGRRYWFDTPLEEMPLTKLATSRAYLTQKTNMSLSFPVHEVVMMGRYPHFKSSPAPIDFDIVEECMRQTDILSLQHQAYSTLSGGEQQRIHLARVFAQLRSGTSPKLLLLDEPLNNLDLRHQLLTLEHCKDFAQEGNLVIMVMHDLNLVSRYADRVILMAGGKIIANDHVEEVFTDDTLSTAYKCPIHVIRHPDFESPIVTSGNIHTPQRIHI